MQRPIAQMARPDRSKISLKNNDEIKYWIRHFDVTHEQLLRVIEKVGNSAASVRKHQNCCFTFGSIWASAC